ncbi:PIII-type proteinase precursor [Anaerohalosphaera lusitana]|uniref:PIII-type proteinase n=1 Tax=Anaerohalosphaera lusitana TaxID=1936003 RepID=A0A1U9NQN5_9BACT|nr:S8 family serine peptidase [Anaerohalosphaera lusitana]AQT70243.1 PIII-type proteinase precursor [Anaerohalosphaera lusitana]
MQSKLRVSLNKVAVSALVLLMMTAGGVNAAEQNEPLPLHPGALGYAGIHSLRETDPNMTGAGIRIASICRSLTYANNKPEFDYLINREHQCFDAQSIDYIDGPELGNGLSDHATAVAAILTGFDAMATHPLVGDFVFEGAAPDAKLEVYEFWNFIRSYVFSGNDFSADIATMSVGTALQTWWTRGIDKLAEETGVPIVASIGNGNSVYDPPLYPAMGSNVIGVGVIDPVNSESLVDRLCRFYLPRSDHSSFGPAADGRCGPDIVAPANSLVPSVRNEYDYEACGNWSSFAAPVAAGTAALLKQRVNAEPNLAERFNGRGANCVIKAILLNSARKMPYWHKGDITAEDDHEVPLDHLQGAGALDAVAAMDQLTAGPAESGINKSVGWDKASIDPADESVVYEVSVDPAEDANIAVTLNWNRRYADQYPFEALSDDNSDLRLEIWGMDPYDPSRDKLIDFCDSSKDNLEHIFCPVDPAYSDYMIVVRYSGRTELPRTKEVFGLAWNFEAKPLNTDLRWFDLNGDGESDEADLLEIMTKAARINREDVPVREAYGDINLDGQIDVQDISAFLSNVRKAEISKAK